MGTLAMAFDVIANDKASTTFGKVGDSASKMSKSIEQAAQAMQKAASAEADAVGKVRAAQARLDDVRKSGKASASTLIRAEEQLASAQRLQVRSQGDAVRAAGGHERALKELGDQTQRTAREGKSIGSAFASGIKLGAAAIGVAAIAGGVAVMREGLNLAKSSIVEARESQQVGAKTEAIIKATGGAAKISASQLGNLTTAISNKTGVDDEAIHSGSNLLLTFKNVRNEAGKGNDVFNRATEAAVDLSKAGFGSIDSASKGLGKALQDPVKGITALSKAGVTFTDQQKEQIKALVKSGDVLGAQKIILGEVEGQVGGVAAASTTAGEKLKTAFDNAKESIGTAFLPVLDKAEDGLRKKLLPVIIKDIVPALPKIARALGTGITLLGSFGRLGGSALKPFVKSLTGGSDVLKEFADFLSTHQADVTGFFVKAGLAGIAFAKGLVVVAAGSIRATQLVLTALSGIARASTIVFGGFLTQAQAAFGWIPGLGPKLDAAKTKFDAFGNGAADGLQDASAAAGGIADGLNGKLLPALDAASNGLKTFGAKEVGSAGQRDRAAALAQAIDGIGTKADGSQIKLKHFSDISKLSGKEQKGLTDRIKDAREALKDQITAAQKAGTGQKALTKTWEKGKDKLRDEFIQMGLSKTEAGKLADKYAGIKPKVKTNFSAPGLKDAKNDAGALKNTLTTMPKIIQIKINQSVATKGNRLAMQGNGFTGGVWAGADTTRTNTVIKAAAGQVLPGWSPGADIHKFYSATAGELHLAGGESIMVPQFTRLVGGAAGINRLNREAEAGRLGTSPTARFAGGGSWMPAAKTVSVQPFAGGGVAQTQNDLSELVQIMKTTQRRGTRGPLVHVDRVDSNVDLDLFAAQAEFLDRRGSFS